MSELLRELEEDLRNERLQKFWHSFGKAIIALSVVIVCLTAATVIWQNVARGRAMEKTSQLIKGSDRIRVEDYKGAVDAFAALDGEDFYAAMAALRKAQAQAALGDGKAAEKAYAAAGKSGAFADLASLLAEGKSAGAPPADTPFLYSHREKNAWRLLKEGEKEQAAQEFSLLKENKEAPRSIRQRAAIMLDYLAPSIHEK